MAGTTILGGVIDCTITRTEDDSDDLTIRLTDDTGSAAVVVGWAAELSIGSNNDTPLMPAQVYSGVGIAGGLIPIDMTAFNLGIGSYKYDIRIVDTVTPDTPARVYFKGSFKVTSRIN